MINKMKHVVLANDLAGLGKVALTNAIPIMACAKIETSILPTVILSSHTGGFKNIHIDDYTDGMQGFLKQWNSLDLNLDAILSGYLKSEKQIDLLLEFRHSKALKDALLIVDPVMADNGKFYSGFDKQYAKKMKELCKNADYIMPNITEACLLTDAEHLLDNSYTKEDIDELILNLAALGAKNIMITGVNFDEDNLAVAYFDAETKKIGYVYTKKLAHKFFGTGDLFTAIVSAGIIRGIDLESSVRLAVKWLEKCLDYTISSHKDLQYGVCFEPFLGDFIKGMDELASTSS